MQWNHRIVDYSKSHQIAEITQRSHKFHDTGGAENNHNQGANKKSNMWRLEFRMQPGENVREMFIAPQCVQNSGAGAQCHTKCGKTRHYSRYDSGPTSPGAEKPFSSEDERNFALGEFSIIGGAHHNTYHEDVDCRTHAQSDQNSSRNVLARLNDLFGRIRNKFEPDIGDIDEGHSRNKGTPSHWSERLQIRRLNISETEHCNSDQNRQFHQIHHGNNYNCFLHSP